MKMSKRDKYLLLGVLVIAIWVLGIMFFVTPQLEDNKSMKTSLSAAESELSSLKVQAEAAAGMRNAASSRYDEVKTGVENKFYQPLKATDLLGQLEQMFQADQITIQSQTLSNWTSTSVAGYNTATTEIALPLDSDAVLQPESSAADSSGSSNTATSTPQTVSVGLCTITVSYETTYGKLQDFMAHLKTNNKKSMFISTVTIDGMGDGEKEMPISKFTDDTKISGSMTLLMYVVPALQEITFQ